MNALPSSIEVALSEAGFSATEILIVQRLVQEPAITIRQLAAKTGKSTGVLDQAMKKLLRKRIVNRELINDTPKYTLNSLASVSQWILQDVQSKRDALLRRYQNFESFMATLEMDKARPEMKYFEGVEGMQQAYMKLLESGEEMKEYFPVLQKEEEDPLREFRVKYFRARQSKKIFTRVIAHDTPLGRRYQSKDAFEYRQTVLVPAESCPISFEKIIVGDTVACFDHAEKKVCFIKYSEFAKSECNLFDAHWKANVDRLLPNPKPVRPVALKTKILSGLREAFLSPSSVAVLVSLACISSVITYAVYSYALNIYQEQIGKKLMVIANNASQEIRYEDVNSIKKAADMRKPEYQNLYSVLNHIRDASKIKFAYILRPTSIPHIWEFVADADANYFAAYNKDFDGDGVLTKADENVVPGVAYDVSNYPNFEAKALFEPTYEKTISTDQWGSFLTASAPIFDSENNPVAIIGVDEDVTMLYSQVRSSFFPLVWFFGLFAVFLLVRFLSLIPGINPFKR